MFKTEERGRRQTLAAGVVLPQDSFSERIVTGDLRAGRQAWSVAGTLLVALKSCA